MVIGNTPRAIRSIRRVSATVVKLRIATFGAFSAAGPAVQTWPCRMPLRAAELILTPNTGLRKVLYPIDMKGKELTKEKH
jgi:hypothetical protein